MEDAIALHNEVDYFYELRRDRLRRWALGAAYAVRPVRASILPRVISETALYLLQNRNAKRELPDLSLFHGDAGFVGVCDDLSVPNLVQAYSSGVFPFCHVGPVKWWCPAERAVLFFEKTHIDDGVRKLLRKRKYRVSFDYAFASVMEACSKPRPGKTPLTWLTPKVMKAYEELYRAGYAHSVEVWDSNDQLVGGMYGVAIGDAFFGESQFSLERDTSKLASAVLNRHLHVWGFGFRDVRWMTELHAKAGAQLVNRDDFLALVRKHVRRPCRTDLWEVDETLDVASWRPRSDPEPREPKVNQRQS